MLDEALFSTGIQGGGFALMSYVVWEAKKSIDRNTALFDAVFIKKVVEVNEK